MSEHRYPPNNDEAKRELARREDVKPVVHGKTSLAKEGPAKSFFRALFNGTPSDVGRYLLYDKLIPFLQDGLYDMFCGSLERTIYGSGNTAPRSRGRREDPYYYSNISSRGSRERRYEDDRGSPRRYGCPEVTFHDRADAEEVLRSMTRYYEEYGSVPVAYYLDISDQKSEYTDNDWGWTSMNGVGIRPARGGGYFIDLPRPIAL